METKEIHGVTTFPHPVYGNPVFELSRKDFDLLVALSKEVPNFGQTIDWGRVFVINRVMFYAAKDTPDLIEAGYNKKD